MIKRYWKIYFNHLYSLKNYLSFAVKENAIRCCFSNPVYDFRKENELKKNPDIH